MSYTIGGVTLTDYQLKSFRFSKFDYDEIINESISTQEKLIKNLKTYYNVTFQFLSLVEKENLVEYFKTQYEDNGIITMVTVHPNIQNNLLGWTSNNITPYIMQEETKISQNTDLTFDVSIKIYRLEVI